MIELNYDVAVLGGGPAGIGAAISARRLGAKVLLVEKYGMVGGMSTTGMLNVWCGDSQSSIFKQLVDKTTKTFPSGRRVFAPEVLKPLYIELLENAGVETLLHTTVTGVSISGGVISSVTAYNKSGEIKINANTFIDCTGDGDVAYLAGVPFEMGREDGLTQPVTVEFMIGGVDDERAIYREAHVDDKLKAKMQEYLADGRVPFPVGMIILLEALEPNVAYCNMTNVIGVDGTNAFELSKAEFEARKQIPKIINFLRNEVPGYENCVALTSAVYAGVRESRRFKGAYELKPEDIQTARTFEDWLVYGADYCFGVHNPNGKVENIQGKPQETGGTYTIPYGCFTPVGVKNLLLAGRCISGDHYAHSSYRVMPICFAMGEGVGTAVAYAIKNNKVATELSLEDIKEVQTLIKQGL